MLPVRGPRTLWVASPLTGTLLKDGVPVSCQAVTRELSWPGHKRLQITQTDRYGHFHFGALIVRRWWPGKGPVNRIRHRVRLAGDGERDADLLRLNKPDYRPYSETKGRPVELRVELTDRAALRVGGETARPYRGIGRLHTD